MKSIIRWVGGKARVMEEVLKEFPSDHINTYYEPFIGGASVLLNVLDRNLCDKAIVGDSNEELINCYQQLQKDCYAVIKEYKQFTNSKDAFFKIREMDREPAWLTTNPAFRAARFLYIIKMSFNGLWRVNKKGFNNSPFGRVDEITYDDKEIELFSKIIQSTEFKVCDFTKLLSDVKEKDFVYMDPPYIPISETATFTRYVKEDFTDDKHNELRTMCDELTKKNVKFLLSNSDCDRTRKLFSGYNIIQIDVRRSIAATNVSRGVIKELLIKNF